MSKMSKMSKLSGIVFKLKYEDIENLYITNGDHYKIDKSKELFTSRYILLIITRKDYGGTGYQEVLRQLTWLGYSNTEYLDETCKQLFNEQRAIDTYAIPFTMAVTNPSATTKGLLTIYGGRLNDLLDIFGKFFAINVNTFIKYNNTVNE